MSLQAQQPLFQMASRVAVRIRSSAAGGAAAVRVSHVEASICTDFAYQGLSCLKLQGTSTAVPPTQKLLTSYTLHFLVIGGGAHV